MPEEQAPLKGLDVQVDLTYTEHPVKILETSEWVTWRRSDLYRASGEDTGDIRESYTELEDQGVQNVMEWPHREDELQKTYPDPFASQPLESRDEIPVRG